MQCLKACCELCELGSTDSFCLVIVFDVELQGVFLCFIIAAGWLLSTS